MVHPSSFRTFIQQISRRGIFSRGAILSLAFIAFYILAFVWLHPLFGDSASAFSIFPVFIASWHFGLLTGLVWCLAVIAVDILLFSLTGHTDINLILNGGIPGALALLAATLITGWVRGLWDKAMAELADHRASEQDLRNSEQQYRRLAEAEGEQRRLAEALRDIAAALNSTLELEGVLDCILENLQKVTSFDAVNIMLVENEHVRIVRHLGYRERDLVEYAQSFRRPMDGIACFKWMAENLAAFVIPDTALAENWIIFPPTTWIRSYAGIPIIARNTLIGFLNFNSATPGFFQPEHAGRLQPFAEQAALAIENARAYEDAQKSARRLEMINQVSTTLNRPMELEDVLRVAAQSLTEALHIDQVNLALFDDDHHHMNIVAESLLPGRISAIGVEIPYQESQRLMEAFAHQKSILFTEIQQDKRFGQLLPAIEQYGIQTLLVIPFISQGIVFGLIGCDLTGREHEFGKEEIELAETLSNLAAVRIEQARLFAAERRRSSELSMLHDTLLDITLPHELPDLLRKIVERAAWLLSAPAGTLYLCDEEKQELRCMVSFNTTYDHVGHIHHYGEGAAGAVACSEQPLLVQNYPESPYNPAGYQYDTRPFSVLSVPVFWQGKVTGVIQLVREEGLPHFSAKDIQLLGLFSNQVAISLENARLLHEIQQIAIQDTLTGLYNRRGLEEIGCREIERSRRFNRPLAALMLDIDHFKKINDGYGHPTGDQVLVGLAEVLRENLRGIDVLGRYGGEEFLVLLPENDHQGAFQIAERTRACIETTPFQTHAGILQVTVSIGVAILEDAMDGLPDLVRNADRALYAAKHAGRNKVMN